MKIDRQSRSTVLPSVKLRFEHIRRILADPAPRKRFAAFPDGGAASISPRPLRHRPRLFLEIPQLALRFPLAKRLRFLRDIRFGEGLSDASSPPFRDKHFFVVPVIRCLTCLLIVLLASTPARSDTSGSDAAEVNKSAQANESQSRALLLLNQTIHRLAGGPAFNAKVRQRMWAVGREVVGIGTYEQAGYGSGRFNLQIAMLDGSGKHTLQQISDGRLAWTRTVIADQVSLRRVDVGRLDEWIPAQARRVGRWHEGIAPRSSTQDPGDPGAEPTMDVAPRLIVGAWTEMLDTMRRNHVLRLGTSQIESLPVLVITGSLRDGVRSDVLSEAGGNWPEMYPTTVKVAIAAVADPETGFGEGLPVRFEFWSDPVPNPGGGSTGDRSRLIALIELFAIYPMTAPPVERFRFENQDAEVNFVNETDKYLSRYGVRITDSQRRLLLR